jgi:hypothetical protein
VDVAKKLDVNKEEIFSVITPINNKVRYMPSREADNRATLENENMSFPSTSGAEPMNNNAEKESYSARFERMYVW